MRNQPQGNDIFGQLGQLLGLAQGAQNLQKGQQEMAQNPQSFDLQQQINQAHLQGLQGQNELQPYKNQQAQFDARHQQDEFDSSQKLKEMMGLGHLASANLLGPGYMDPEQVKLMLHQKLGLGPEYDFNSGVQDYIKRKYPKESASFLNIK